MRLLTCGMCVFVAFAASASVDAETTFDAVARAKAIAPLVGEETLVVIRVDITRMSPQPMLGFLRSLSLVSPQEMWDAQTDGARRAGVKDVYFMAPPTIFIAQRPQMLMLMAIPVSSDEQEAAVRAALKLKPEEGRRIGSVLAIGRSVPKEFHPVERPELATAFEAAGDTAAQLILIPPTDASRVMDELLPQLPKELGGGPSSVLTRGVRWAAAGIDISPRKTAQLVIKSEDAQAAETLRAKLVELVRLAGEHKEVRKKVPEFEAVAAFLTPRIEGDRLVVSSDEKTELYERVLTALRRPFLEAAAKATSVDNLKHIGLAIYNYEQVNRHFPQPASYGPDGKPLLSWRVHILPYIEQDALFKQFHLDESWDSPHNRTLIDQMPTVYRLPISKAERGRTNYLLPVGGGAAFSADKPTVLKDIKDGTSNTIMVVEVDDEHAVTWTKPDDLPFDPKDPTKGLGRFFGGGFNVMVCDGSVRSLAWQQEPEGIEKLRACFTRAGGERITAW